MQNDQWLEDPLCKKIMHPNKRLLQRADEQMEKGNTSFYYNSLAYFIQPNYNIQYRTGYDKHTETNTNVAKVHK